MMLQFFSVSSEYDLILFGLINCVCVDKKGDSVSSKILKAMENIDDECEEQGIIFVKVRILSASGKHQSNHFHFTPGTRQEMRPRPAAWVWLSCRGWCTTRTTSPTSTPATSGLERETLRDYKSVFQDREGRAGLAGGADGLR